MPQSVELRWPDPVTLGSVELTFDSQLSGWIWAGQFRLIARDYLVEIRDPATEAWFRVVQEHGNYQRRRVHSIARSLTDALRVTVFATNGGQTARIVEIRAYRPDA